MAKEVRGMGLLLALGLTKEVAVDVVNECRVQGLLVNPVRPDAVRLIPPLIVSEEEADQGIEILDAALSSVGAA